MADFGIALAAVALVGGLAADFAFPASSPLSGAKALLRDPAVCVVFATEALIVVAALSAAVFAFLAEGFFVSAAGRFLVAGTVG